MRDKIDCIVLQAHSNEKALQKTKKIEPYITSSIIPSVCQKIYLPSALK